MPKTITKRPMTAAEYMARNKSLLAEQDTRSPLEKAVNWTPNKSELVRSLLSGVNDVVGRGTIAGLLGTPGDLAGLAENSVRGMMGKPQVQPWGGSEHIGQMLEQAGLVSDVRRPKTELAASLISPGAAAKTVLNAPKMAMTGLRLMNNLDSAPTMARMGQRGAIDVWHGTDVEFNTPNTPLFLSDRATAESYAKQRALESGSKPVLMGGKADFKKIATDDDVLATANELGLQAENDMAFSLLDPNIAGKVKSRKVIDALRAKGFDSANIQDFSPDDPFTLKSSYVAFDPAQLNLSPVTAPQPGLLGKMVAPQDEVLRVAQAESGILGDMVQPQKLKRADIVQKAKALGLPTYGKNEQILERVKILESDPATWTADDFSKVADYLDIHQDFRGGSANPKGLESILSEGLRSGMSDNLGAMYSNKYYTYGKGLSGGRSFIFPSASIKYKSKTNPSFAPGNKPLFYFDAEKGQNIYEAMKSAKRNPNFGK